MDGDKTGKEHVVLPFSGRLLSPLSAALTILHLKEVSERIDKLTVIE